MSLGPEVLLARGGADEPSDWAWIGVVFALYLLIGYGLEYRSKRRGGAARPAKAAVDGLFSERGSDAGQRLTSRVVMMCGALVAGLAAFLTRSAPAAVRYPVVGLVALLGIFAWAYFDHRTEPRGEDGS
ncbi:hypothetical protein [Streptomyces sp. SID10815]|uniref:hypothetical protein n=1 Tax=Streptomyces sp. SID10815 TaxID=2706027 RepID=UPI0013C8DF4A|nr:hypothetical protein [Streptomyces sp. SID10815]NEA50716.1 hypothetical protein [Streptomyces sp. SID10815]